MSAAPGKLVHRVDLPSGRVAEVHIQQLEASTVIRFRGVQPALDDLDQVALMEALQPIVFAASRPGIPMVLHNPHSGEVATVYDEDEAGVVCIDIDVAQA